MATKAPQTTKALLDKLSTSLKQTISNEAEKHNAKAQQKEQREKREQELLKDTATMLATIRIV